MNAKINSLIGRMHKDQSGQILIIVAFMLVVLLGFVGLVIDAGRLYISAQELQNSCNAAALAGAQALPVTSGSSGAIAVASSYSGVSGDYNANGNLPNVAMSSGFPKTLCLTSSIVNLPCLNSSGNIVTSGGANAIQVQETVSVPMTLAALVGVKPITLTATATAAMRGAARAPYNVVLLIDATHSMQDTDTDAVNTSCVNQSKEYCALLGVQTLLGELSPCGYGQTCGGTGSTQMDEVSVMTFPAVTSASASTEYCNPSGTVSVQPYPLPAIGSTPPSTPTYQIINFSSNYRTTDSATSLNTSSSLAAVTGYTGTGCTGMQDPGGEGTYYAAAIYSAEDLLVAQQTSRGSVGGVPTTQNALIILSDGDATACYSGQSGCEYTASLASNASKTATTYPSYVDQCQQAIAATQYAVSKGITVYSVAYDSEGSGSCVYDTSASPPVNEAGITACQTMEQMASTASKFYTSNSSCALTGGNTVMSLNAIFTAIAGDMTVARLVPNSTP